MDTPDPKIAQNHEKWPKNGCTSHFWLFFCGGILLWFSMECPDKGLAYYICNWLQGNNSILLYLILFIRLFHWQADIASRPLSCLQTTSANRMRKKVQKVFAILSEYSSGWNDQLTIQSTRNLNWRYLWRKWRINSCVFFPEIFINVQYARRSIRKSTSSRST